MEIAAGQHQEFIRGCTRYLGHAPHLSIRKHRRGSAPYNNHLKVRSFKMSKTRFLLVTMSFTPFCLSAIIPTHIDRRQVLETAPDLPYTWFYKGCFVDRIGDRTLKRATTRSLDMTGGQCVRWCLERGYNFAGTEWGKEVRLTFFRLPPCMRMGLTKVVVFLRLPNARPCPH